MPNEYDYKTNINKSANILNNLQRHLTIKDKSSIITMVSIN